MEEMKRRINKSVDVKIYYKWESLIEYNPSVSFSNIKNVFRGKSCTCKVIENLKIKDCGGKKYQKRIQNKINFHPLPQIKYKKGVFQVFHNGIELGIIERDKHMNFLKTPISKFAKKEKESKIGRVSGEFSLKFSKISEDEEKRNHDSIEQEESQTNSNNLSHSTRRSSFHGKRKPSIDIQSKEAREKLKKANFMSQFNQEFQETQKDEMANKNSNLDEISGIEDEEKGNIEKGKIK